MTNVTISPFISRTFLSWIAMFHLRQPLVCVSHTLLLRTSGPVPFWTCICSNVETILSWTYHVYRPFEFRTPLGTSILIIQYARACSPYECLFWERCGFHVSFSGRDMSGNVWNRPLESSMVDMGISSKIMNPPLPNVIWHSGIWSNTVTPSFDQTFQLIVTLLPNWTLLPFLTSLPYCGGFHRTFATSEANRQSTLSPPDTWSCPIWDLHLF